MNKEINVVFYQGKCVKDKTVQKRIKDICRKRMTLFAPGEDTSICKYKSPRKNYWKFDWSILGTNWYMELATYSKCVEIFYLISDGENPFLEARELYLTLKWLFMEYSDREVLAYCNASSRKFLYNLVRRGIIEITAYIASTGEYDEYRFVPTKEFLERNKNFSFKPEIVYDKEAIDGEEEQPENEHKIISFKPRKKDSVVK